MEESNPQIIRLVAERLLSPFRKSQAHIRHDVQYLLPGVRARPYVKAGRGVDLFLSACKTSFNFSF